MAIPIPDAVRELLEAPNYVHLSTLRADGSPRNWVVWVGLVVYDVPAGGLVRGRGGGSGSSGHSWAYSTILITFPEPRIPR